MFDWSNRMIGQEDPEFQTNADGENYAEEAAIELFAYAAELFAKKRIDPTEDLMSVLTRSRSTATSSRSSSSSCSSCCSRWPATRRRAT